MWPFKRQPSAYVFKHTPFHDFRDIGETFNYLGRECIVTSHGGYVVGLFISFVPELTAEYCDNNGVIRQAKFSLSELPGLIKQNGGK